MLRISSEKTGWARFARASNWCLSRVSASLIAGEQCGKAALLA
jgi:hypothetical protein